MVKSRDTSVVKIDSKLLKSVEDLISLEEFKFQFVNKKQFIDIAVNSYLKEVKNGGEKKR